MMQFDATADTDVNVSRFRYPASAMAGDYLRAAAGLGPTVLILSATPVGSVAAVVLGGFAALFGAFAIRTARRHGTSLEIDETALRATGLRQATIPWDQLDRMKLAFYSTRRDRKSGWMQLQLGAGRTRIGLDSRLDGFERLVRYAATAAAARGLQLTDATAANLQALGIRIADPRGSR
jgi:hypothetical protein